MPTTNLPEGVTNAVLGSALENFLAPDPTRFMTWFDDFELYTAAQWTVTETQSGATQAIVAGNGGLLALVNTGANDDQNTIQWINEIYRPDTSKSVWLKTRFKVSDASASDVVIGWQITNTTPLATTDGIYLRKDNGSTTISLVIEKNSTETVVPIGALVSDTYADAGFYFDASQGLFFVYLNGVRTNLSAVLTNVPNDEDLAPIISVTNGDGNARTLTVDYVFSAVER